MNQNEFWLRLWQSVIAGLCVLALTIGSCGIYTASRISKAIANGADPISARCAFSDTGRSPVCVLKAQ